MQKRKSYNSRIDQIGVICATVLSGYTIMYCLTLIA